MPSATPIQTDRHNRVGAVLPRASTSKSEILAFIQASPLTNAERTVLTLAMYDLMYRKGAQDYAKPKQTLNSQSTTKYLESSSMSQRVTTALPVEENDLQLCTPVPTKGQNQCNLLVLPGEIRNQIYRLCLISNEVIHIDCEFQSSNDYKRKLILAAGESAVEEIPVDRERYRLNQRHAPLAETCKTIRSEALGLYYAENVFTFNLNTQQKIDLQYRRMDGSPRASSRPTHTHRAAPQSRKI